MYVAYLSVGVEVLRKGVVDNGFALEEDLRYCQ
jgi:hypothetical protein